MESQHDLEEWRSLAHTLEQNIAEAIVGQKHAIRLITIAVFARGHVLLEGPVGVGKTTLLRAVARCLGGTYERIEGTIDLMPTDLIYYTHLDDQGRPRVEPGPLLRQGEQLSTFFFNEINRARPQIHSLLLRVMAERSVTAFNREYYFKHLQVFADRNQVEREETFELPAAARDRFMMEININHPEDDRQLDDLMFNPRYHNTDQLIETVASNILPYQELLTVAPLLQKRIHASETLHQYALTLWRATHNPTRFNIELDDFNHTENPVVSGCSPRGMSYLIQAARVQAWLKGRDAILPEDIQYVFHATMAHRIFLQPAFEYRRNSLIPQLLERILNTIPAP